MSKDSSGSFAPTRRNIMQTAAAAAAASTLNFANAKARAQSDKKPNILVILPDQYRHDAFGITGMLSAKTPNFDKIASGGTRFSTTWVQSPVCRPSRASLITGRYVPEHGFIHNILDQFDPKWPTMMKSLQKAGYYTVSCGKTDYHLPQWLREDGMNGLKNKPPYDSREVYPFLRSFGWDVVHDNAGRNRDAVENYISEYTEFLKERGLLKVFQWQINSSGGQGKEGLHYQPHVSLLPQDAENTSFIANQALDWLKDYDGKKPFLLSFSPHSPHVPEIADAIWAHYYLTHPVKLGPRDVPKSENPICQKWLEGQLRGSDYPALTDELTEACLRMYLGMCSLVDQKVGDIMALLEKRGWLDNTWIVVLSDHGEMMGDHHMMGKGSFYKASVQIPGFIRPPKRPSEREISHPVEMIDMTATILAIAGAEALPDSKGISLLNAMNGKPISKQAVFSAISDNKEKQLMAAVRTVDYRYTMEWKTKTPCEFFDMKNDPDELINLIGDPSKKALIDDHYALLADNMNLPLMKA